MCPPDYFEVTYEINKFMEGNRGRADPIAARKQWDDLYSAVSDTGTKVNLLNPEPGHPDLVFTANGGLVYGKSVVLSRFAHAERRGEEPFFTQWFQASGSELIEVPSGEYFEGEGDVVIFGSTLFLGTHSRTTTGAALKIAEVTELETVPLELNPKGLYHLDTCMFAATGVDKLFYCPDAFTKQDRAIIVNKVGTHKLVEVTWEEAICFACNTVVLGDTAISPACPPSFGDKVRSVGLNPVSVQLSEFLKAGGAAKCLVLHVES